MSLVGIGFKTVFAACKPTHAPYLCAEVFQVEHLQRVTGLDVPSRKAASEMQKQHVDVRRTVLKAVESGNQPSGPRYRVGRHETRSCDGDADRCPKTPTPLLL